MALTPTLSQSPPESWEGEGTLPPILYAPEVRRQLLLDGADKYNVTWTRPTQHLGRVLPLEIAGAATARRPAFFLCLVIFAALAFTGRLCEIYRPFSSDAAMFIYMGKLVSEGGRVGVEMIDNKFPTVGLMTSGAWRMFGGNWPAYVLLETGMVALAIVLMARSARRNLGPRTVLPFALFALVYLNFRFAVDGGFQLESIQIFFEMVAAASVLSALMADDARDSFVVGLSAGMAALLKPSGLAVLFAFAIAMMLRRRRMDRLMMHGVCALLGLSIPAGAMLIYLADTDLLSRFPEIQRQIGRVCVAFTLGAVRPAQVGDRDRDHGHSHGDARRDLPRP